MGLVMDFGDDVSHTMTIYEGYALLHAVLLWNNIIVSPNVSVVWCFFCQPNFTGHRIPHTSFKSSVLLGRKSCVGSVRCGIEMVPSLSSCSQMSQSVNIVASCSISVGSTQKRRRSGAAALRSPAVRPGHDFKILNLTLEFEYLVGGYTQDGNINLGIGISNIVVHSRILVDNPTGSMCGGHDFNFGFGALNATGLAVEAPIGSTITLHVQGSRSISL